MKAARLLSPGRLERLETMLEAARSQAGRAFQAHTMS